MSIKRVHLDVLSVRNYLAYIEMPEGFAQEGFAYYNGGVRCDMIQGPCACGSWHTIDDWPFDMRVAIRILRRRGFVQR